MRSVWIIRLGIVALSAVLAVVLIARGNVVVGGIIGALAVMRLLLFATVMRRRREFRRRLPRRMDNRR